MQGTKANICNQNPKQGSLTRTSIAMPLTRKSYVCIYRHKL